MGLIRAREVVYASETGYQLHLVDAEGALDELEVKNAAESEVQDSLTSYHDLIKIQRAAIQQRAEISAQGLSRSLARRADELVADVGRGLDTCQQALSDMLNDATLRLNPCLHEAGRGPGRPEQAK